MITQRWKVKKALCAVVEWIGMFSVWGVWVVRAVPPPTCAHGGSVGALGTPKLCPVGLEPARGPSEGTWNAVKFRGETNRKWRQFEYRETRIN